MILGNKALRDRAIPFESLPVDDAAFIVSLNEGNFFLAPAFEVESRIFPIVLSRPEAGQIVELRLSFRLLAAAAAGFSLKLAIGTLDPDTLYWDQSEDQRAINLSHRNITGQDAAFTVAAAGELFVDDLDLLKAAPQPGDANFNSDAYCLLLAFETIPATTTGWEMREFRAHGSSQQGLI